MILDIPIIFYNTKGRKKEVFKPLRKGVVKYYSCGPTVYDYPHIGNMFSFTLSDLLRRLFTFWGYKVVQIMNITDVGHLSHDADMGEEDRIMKALGRWQKQGKRDVTVQDIIDYYTAYFIKYLKLANIKLPHFMPFASHHIKEMQDIISCLLKKGYAYKTDTAVYYDVSKFKDYTKLYPQALDEKLVKAREEVVVDKTKKSQVDFRLWQLDQPNHIMQWDSPWGKGFPGWHIECSAMSMKYGGHTLDLHTGGIDHIPVHHTNEIAQSEACTNQEYANYWLHNQHVKVAGDKMAKSLGNFKTFDDVLNDGYQPWHVKMFYTLHHYRSIVDFTSTALDNAINVYDRVLFYFQVAKTRVIKQAQLLNKVDEVMSIINNMFPELPGWEYVVDLSMATNVDLTRLLKELNNRELPYVNILTKDYDGQKVQIVDNTSMTYFDLLAKLEQLQDLGLFDKETMQSIQVILLELLKVYANDLGTPQLWSLVLSKLKKNYIKAPIINLVIISLVSFVTGVPILPFILPEDMTVKQSFSSKQLDLLSLGKYTKYAQILEILDIVNESRKKKDYNNADKYKQKLLDFKTVREIVDFPEYSIVII